MAKFAYYGTFNNVQKERFVILKISSGGKVYFWVKTLKLNMFIPFGSLKYELFIVTLQLEYKILPNTFDITKLISTKTKKNFKRLIFNDIQIKKYKLF